MKKLLTVLSVLFLCAGLSSCYVGYYPPGPRYYRGGGPGYYRGGPKHYHHPPARGHYHNGPRYGRR